MWDNLQPPIRSSDNDSEPLSDFERRYPRSPHGEGFIALLHHFMKEFDPVPAKNRVPVRFGLSGMLGLLTILSGIFVILRAFDAHASAYVYFTAQTLVICLMQMKFPDAVRGASMLAGAVLLTLFVFGSSIAVDVELWKHTETIVQFLAGTPLLMMFGAFCGYLNGALAAGIFTFVSYYETNRDHSCDDETNQFDMQESQQNERTSEER